MIILEKYIKKIQSIIDNETSIKKDIQEVFNSQINTKIPTASITFRPPTLFLKISPLIKNEIVIHKKEIIRRLQEKDLSITDIQ